MNSKIISNSRIQKNDFAVNDSVKRIWNLN